MKLVCESFQHPPEGTGIYTNQRQQIPPSFGRVGNELASFRGGGHW